MNGSSKWDDYRFVHWSACDTFCYFSHAFVTIPPLAWLQAAHRHGTAVIGTIITEGADGQRRLSELLHDDETISLAVDSLVWLAQHLRFEGWLVNIECSLRRVQMPRLLHFVRLLHERMHATVGERAQVIWYDSVLAASGELAWQNELNASNRAFYDACDGIFLNYNWTDEHLERSVALVHNLPAQVARIYAGIDVFGRGQVARFRSAETLARVRHLAPHMSVAVFAPGWTFEGARELGVNIGTRRGTDVCAEHFRERDERFWALLWPMLWTAGPARLPFRTGFCQGAGRQRHRDGRLHRPVQTWWDLRRQAWQPSVPGGERVRGWWAEAYAGGSCLRLTGSEYSGALSVRRLFVCDFAVGAGFVLAYAFKSAFGSEDFEVDGVAIVLRLKSSGLPNRQCRVECGNSPATTGNERSGNVTVRLAALRGDDLRAVLIHIAERGEHSLPAQALQSGVEGADEGGWQVSAIV